MQGGDAWGRVMKLIEDSLQTPGEKTKLVERAGKIFATLIDAGVVQKVEQEDGSATYVTTVDLPDDFALDQPLSPFLLAALELLDPESETYALDVISMVEATLEDPRQVLRVQERHAREKAIAEMKADGIEYEERLEKIQEVTYPKPLEDLLSMAFEQYCQEVPWANDFELRAQVGAARHDRGRERLQGLRGPLRPGPLRGHSVALPLRRLPRRLPAPCRTEKRDERLEDIVAWLGLVVRSTDSSLVDEWEGAEPGLRGCSARAADEVVHGPARPHRAGA